MTKTVTLALAILVALTGLAGAKTYPHGGAKVSITIPDRWKVDTEEDSLTATTPDDLVNLTFMVLAADDMDEALKALDTELDKVVKHVKVGEAQKVTINGMKGITVDGTGTVDGVKMDLGVLILATKSHKILLGLGFGGTGMYAKHDKDIDAIFRSITPL